MYKCRICSKEFNEIPPDAIEIAAKRRGTLYQFSGGEVHDLYRARSVSADHRWHKSKTWDCIFCFPKQKLEPPVAHTELLQEVQPPVQAPEVVEEVATGPEAEGDQLSAITTLAHAFRRANRNTK